MATISASSVLSNDPLLGAGNISTFAGGFAVALTLPNLGFMLIGLTLGVLIGVLPGLGGANGVAILLPLTFTMNPTTAIIMLSCIYWGALFGGAITSILFNIPGEPWSVATTFDGHPMAQKGHAGEALTAAFTSSFFGGGGGGAASRLTTSSAGFGAEAGSTGLWAGPPMPPLATGFAKQP